MFTNAVEKMAKGMDFGGDIDELNKFKGDVLEVFAEIFFNAHTYDSSFGVDDYTPITLENDYGVDAIGINPNGDKVAIQIKYRSNPNDLVTYAEIARTYTSGKIQLDLDLDNDKTIYVFTTANGVTIPCQEVLGRRLVVVDRSIIKTVDNNKLFWANAYEQIIQAIPIVDNL